MDITIYTNRDPPASRASNRLPLDKSNEEISMNTANAEITISSPVLTQMRQVIMESHSSAEIEDIFQKAVQVGQYPSLDAAVHAWLEKQLVFRKEELLGDIFEFFLRSLVQDMGRATGTDIH